MYVEMNNECDRLMLDLMKFNIWFCSYVWCI